MIIVMNFDKKYDKKIFAWPGHCTYFHSRVLSPSSILTQCVIQVAPPALDSGVFNCISRNKKGKCTLVFDYVVRNIWIYSLIPIKVVYMKLRERDWKITVKE